MMTKDQEKKIEALSLENAGVSIAITEGYENGEIEARLPDGAAFLVDRFGDVSSFSVREPYWWRG